MTPSAPTSCLVRMVGLGSPHGDDRAGWRLVDWLRSQDVPDGVDAVAAADVCDLVEFCQGCHTLILVDACRSGQPAGTVSRYEWPDPRIECHRRHSTHDLSVPEALQLAEQLGRLPPRVVVYGIEIEDCRPGTELSPVIERTLPELGAALWEDFWQNHVEK